MRCQSTLRQKNILFYQLSEQKLNVLFSFTFQSFRLIFIQTVNTLSTSGLRDVTKSLFTDLSTTTVEKIVSGQRQKSCYSHSEIIERIRLFTNTQCYYKVLQSTLLFGIF